MLVVGVLLALLLTSQSVQYQTTFSLPATTTATLVDLLANSTQHSKLLHLIQITRLVPTLNQLTTSATLFAPTNQAIDSHPALSKLLQDNLQLELRQTLLYHLLNSSLPTHTTEPLLLDTLLYPQPISDDNSNNNKLLLGHQPQKLRIITRDHIRFIGVDPQGLGGIPLPGPSQFQNGTNATLIPIQSILSPPPSLKQLITSTPTLSTYASILPDRLLNQLDLLPHLTIFAPQNQAWDTLSSIELRYLKSSFSADDSIKLFRQATADNVLGSEGIGYAHRLRQVAASHFPLLTLDGKTLSIGFNPNSNKLSINNSEIIEHDILASNGVLHIVPNLLISSGDNPLQLTPEKYLLALNCTKFVTLFRQANLSSTYLTNRSLDKSYTILAVRDDVLASSIDRVNTNDTERLQKSLKYHVIEGTYLIDDLQDGMLLRTELKFKDPKSSSKQRMPVSVSTSNDLNSNKKMSIVGFGGANVLGGDPIQVGNTVIYILSQIVEPPSDLLQVALSDIRFSTGVASIFSAKLDDLLRGVAELTYMMPTNKAFADLGLIMDYLLLERSKPELAEVLKYHGVAEPIYLDELKLGVSQRYPTLAGGELYISKQGPHNVTLHGPSVDGEALNGEPRDARVINRRDVLVDNGAMLFVDQVELPPAVTIDLHKLLLGAKAATMLELLQASNMSWVLDGHHLAGHRGFTVLCPTDAAFTKINLTYYLEDHLRLRALIQQHIIPLPIPPDTPSSAPDPRDPLKPLRLADGATYPTLLSTKEGGPSAFGDVFFRAHPLLPSSSHHSNDDDHNDDDDGGRQGDGGDGGRWIVGIKGARLSSSSSASNIHYASKILTYGKITPQLIPSPSSSSDKNGKSTGGVFVLEDVLVPYFPSFWTRAGRFILLAVALSLAVGGIGWGGWILYRDKIWCRLGGRASRPGGGGMNQGYLVIDPVEE